MKGIRSSALIVATCIGLSGCAELIQVVPYAIQGVQSANASANAPQSDAGVAKLVLAAPTTPEIFVANARTVALRLGYQMQSIQGVGNMQVVTAMKQKIDTGPVFLFAKRDITYNTATIRLDQDAKTIHVSISSMSNTGENAEKMAEEFKENLLKLYAANK